MFRSFQRLAAVPALGILLAALPLAAQTSTGQTRANWTLADRFLGTYELDRLIYGVMGSQLALIPVGRYTMKAEGSFDLAVMPAYKSLTVSLRPSGKWLIGALPGESSSHRWKQEFFLEISKKLARMG